MDKNGYVYIITNKPFGTLYIGVTSDLIVRMAQHRQKLIDGFSKTHGLGLLVCYEMHEAINAAILREKQLKQWQRNWKVRLIMKSNPSWQDLYSDITGNHGSRLSPG